MDDSTVVSNYFSINEWASFSELEKKRYNSLYENHQKLKELGLISTDVPSFMKNSQVKVKKSAFVKTPVKNDLDNDEWTPDKNSYQSRYIKKNCNSAPSDFKSNSTLMHKYVEKILPEYYSPLSIPQSSIIHLWNAIILESGFKNSVKVKVFYHLEENVNAVSKRTKLDDLVRKDVEIIGTPSSSINHNPLGCENTDTFVSKLKERRYPKRNVAKKYYIEDSCLNDDDYIFCDDCDQDYEGSCPLHPFVLLINKEVPRDGSVADRGKATAPWPLSVCLSKIKEAGRGVWTNADLPKGLLFGPYEGRVLDNVPAGEESGYGWRIRNKKLPNKCIDAIDSSVSNWLRYVNCSRCYEETNLAAFQFKGQIYYKTIVPIRR